ncbi:helix-turn-helix domain-containing protein [Actinokineospora pegani]|uniref:helix-turn-helix domain-containing protein n=1 Tax=Actinokineospora pegani TaxID=2654637 RepID=UPI0012EA1036|nr:helix-turn-helix domain-containing protein [Actinokineospora pegani]
MESFGEALKRVRKERGLSLADLQGVTRFSRSHLGNVETGQRPPTEALAKLCDEALDAGGLLTRLAASARTAAGPRRSPAPSQLPVRSRYLVGRDVALRAMHDERADALARGAMALIGIDGAAGIGKTALAVSWAQDVSERYPDGVLFANLRGHSSHRAADPSDVLQDFLTALGTQPDSIPGTLDARTAALRTTLRGQRVLIVLDNAIDAEQVRPLLPSAPGCLVIVTSRTRLGGLSARDGALRLTLDPLTEQDSVDLLTEVVGERVVSDTESARVLVRRCGGLPLALRIAAERVTSRSEDELRHLATLMASRARRLDALSTGGDDTTAIRAVFSWSYVALPARTARMFRLLSLHPGHTMSTEAAAAIAGLHRRQAQAALDELVDAHLLEYASLDRYCFHDLLHLYASERVELDETQADREQARQRVLEWYLHTAVAAMRRISPRRELPNLPPPTEELVIENFDDLDDAAAWCEVELKNCAAATRVANETGNDMVAVLMPVVLCDYLYRRKPWTQWTRAHIAALDAASRNRNENGQAWILNNQGNAALDLGHPHLARTLYAHALTLRKRINDHNGQAWSRVGLGRAFLALGEARAAAAHFEAAYTGFAEQNDVWAWAITLTYLGDCCRHLGQYPAALNYHQEAVALQRTLGDRQAEGCSLERLGTLYSDMEDWPNAVNYLQQAGTVLGEIGDRWGYAQAMLILGDLHQRRGLPSEAAVAWQDAAQTFEALQDPRASVVRRRLART